jgi:prophage maintenance system killer protein
MTNDLAIYQGKNGEIELNVDVRQETIWATRAQIADLFGIDRTGVTRHINNIYATNELDEKVVCAKIAHTTRHGAIDGKNQSVVTEVFNLDMVLSVGYRVNSTKATDFRKWSSKILKDYLLRGAAINQKRLTQLNEVLEIVSRSEIAEVAGVAELIKNYTTALNTLEKYDEGKLKAPKGKKEIWQLSYEEASKYLQEVRAIGGYSELFASERNESFQGIIAGIYQTFGGKELYTSAEEKAANLLYQIVKDHPFFDGNKRSAAAIFVYFLSKNGILNDMDNNTLAAIVLLVALSEPSEKEQMVLLVMNFLETAQ